MSYRPEIKTNANGTTVDFPLDAETVKGVDVVATKVDIPSIYLEGNGGSLTQAQADLFNSGKIIAIFWRSGNPYPYSIFNLFRKNSDIVVYTGNETKRYGSDYYTTYQPFVQIEIENRIWTTGGYESENLYNASQTDNLLSHKQNTLTAGDGITIDSNNEISVTNPVEVMSQQEFDNATGGTTPDVPLDIFGVKEINIDDNLIDGDKAKFLVDEHELTKNIWDGTWKNGYYGTDGYYYSNNTTVCSNDYIEVEANTDYIFNIDREKTSRVCFYNSSKTLISYKNYPKTFTTPSNCKYIRFHLETTYGATYNNDVVISKVGAIVHEKSITPVLLWENGSPTTSMSASILISSYNRDDYSRFIVLVKRATNRSVVFGYNIDNVYAPSISDVITLGITNFFGYYGYARNVDFFKTKIEISDCYQQVGFGSGAVDNSILIIASIYGVRK